jgi:hypothetical protein
MHLQEFAASNTGWTEECKAQMLEERGATRSSSQHFKKKPKFQVWCNGSMSSPMTSLRILVREADRSGSDIAVGMLAGRLYGRMASEATQQLHTR